MTRHIRWGLIFGMTVLIFWAAAAPYWVDFVVSEQAVPEAAQGFPCPVTFEAEVCTLLEAIDAENPLEAEAMLGELQNAPVPAPSDEQDPASVQSDFDPTQFSVFNVTLVRTGRFTEIDRLHRATGTVNVFEIVADGTSTRYLRFEDTFEVERGPDLRVYLSIVPEPRTAAEMLANDTAVEIGILKGNIGGQNYRLPDDVDVTQFRSVVIFSAQYGRIFSTARLEQPL
jgi:hypothetical protein